MKSSKCEIVRMAIENEIAIDKYLCQKMKLNESFLVFKVLRFSNKIRNSYYIFFLFLTPLYFLFQIFICLFSKGKNENIIYDKSIFLSFSSSLKIKNIVSSNFNSSKQLFNCVDGRSLYFLKYMGLSSILKNYFQSVYYFYKLIFKFEYKYIVHFSSILELCVFYDYLFLLKKEGVENIYLSNHYDRWITVLGAISLFNLHVFQHGVVSPNLCIQNKIKSVIHLYCYNENQKNIFIDNILYNLPNKTEYMESKIKLIDHDVCDILIISSPFYVKDEVEVYKKLSDKYITRFRPHPLFINDFIIKNVNNLDLCFGDRFPIPKYCVCRDSTLGIEYETMGFRVIWWSEKDDILKIFSN